MTGFPLPYPIFFYLKQGKGKIHVFNLLNLQFTITSFKHKIDNEALFNCIVLFSLLLNIHKQRIVKYNDVSEQYSVLQKLKQ